jgi:CRISPR-associated protein Cas1
VFGNVQVSTQTIRRLAESGIPVCFFSYGGWFYARSEGIGHKNIAIRVAQYAAAADPQRALAIARRIVVTKILNCRTLLRRNASEVDAQLKELRHLARAARRTPELNVLLGVEGLAARVYFQALPGMLRPAKAAEGGALDFSFEGRNRRPPRDPVNALLSLAYALLAKDWTITLAAVGLDPYLGYLHQPRYGRPALALDLMEEFRPLVAESTVITAINTGVVGPTDFVRSPFGVALTAAARSRFIAAYERRMAEGLTHPIFGYPVSYRRLLELQARLFARHLLGELSAFPEIRTR